MFVVKFGVCGGWLGLMSGASGRWGAGDYLGGIWEDAVSSGGGNCERIRLGLQLAFRG